MIYYAIRWKVFTHSTSRSQQHCTKCIRRSAEIPRDSYTHQPGSKRRSTSSGIRSEPRRWNRMPRAVCRRAARILGQFGSDGLRAKLETALFFDQRRNLLGAWTHAALSESALWTTIAGCRRTTTEFHVATAPLGRVDIRVQVARCPELACIFGGAQ